MARFTGKKTVVTGGTHGMGLGIAQALADGGAEVVLTGRDERKVEQARDQLRTPGVHVVRSDATSAADIDALGGFVADTLGHVDAVFVNHGVAEFQTLGELTADSFDRQFAVNTKGAVFTVKRLAPLLRDGGSVTFTTVANDRIFPGLSGYSGSKEALHAIAKVLAAEFLPRRIRVNSVAPGYIKTPSMGVPGLSDAERAAFEAEGDQTPLGRLGSIEEVAAAALFLGFDATYTTAAELPVDGGFAQGLG